MWSSNRPASSTPGTSEALADNPGALNEDPEGEAWIYKVKISDASQLEDLMDLDGYKALIG